MKFRSKIILFLAVSTALMIISCGRQPEKIYPLQQESVKSETESRLLVAMGDYDYPPFEFNDDKGNPAGFNIDILNRIAAIMHLDIKITLGRWSEVREKLERGEIDIITGMFKTPGRERNADFSIPHFISTYVIFVREGSVIKNLEDLKGKEVIVQEGDLAHDFILENGSAGKIITKRDWNETLTSLSRGEGDCAIAALLQGLLIIDKYKITNVVPLNKFILQRSYCIAVKKDNPELLAEINEGLSILKTSGEYDRIYEKWFSVYETKNFFNHPYFPIIVSAFLFLLLTASGIYFWNILLQKKVRQKILALNNELENSNKIKNQLEKSLAELAESKEEALQSKIDAEKSSEAKSYFLAGVSHELRTPLNGIIGMTNLLYGTDLTVEQTNLLDMLKASADNLFRLMADLLEFSRVASGKFRLEMSPVNLGEFVVNTSSVIRLLAEEKGLFLQVKNSSPGINVLIDRDRLGQIVFNLAGNAVKYTERGGVTLEVSYNGMLQISVTDTGIGMDRNAVNEIFNPFTQISSGGPVKNKGLGLGLAIVKLIVDTFGGDIEVESSPGTGSRFTVRIPCREAEQDTLENNTVKKEKHYNNPEVMKRENLSVLIIEDDNINRIYLERILQKKGWQIEITDNGDDAVEKTKHKHYDIILMDLNLPGIDGLTAAEMIRSFEKTSNRRRSAIIAVTAHAYPEDSAKCTDSGMDGYLSKPFSSRKLLDEIEKVLGNEESSTALY
ncbi:MAG TPA: transporter substrate-binding domain-containing protein [Spirochaetota bacterium]|nr:transporter substrate-binding domain-containing protein [Spirochaetota bacterium]